MNVAEIDALLLSERKRLPAAPQWLPHKSRVGEMKTRIPIEVDGVSSGAEIEVTIRTAIPEYIVIVLLAPECVARLCIGSGHRNRITGETISTAHFHRWADNRHLTARNRAILPYAEILPTEIDTREAAFVWFLRQTGIESPAWLPIVWPGQGGLF